MCFKSTVNPGVWGRTGVQLQLSDDGKLRMIGKELLWVAGLGCSTAGLQNDLSGRYSDQVRSPSGKLVLQLKPYTLSLLFQKEVVWTNKMIESKEIFATPSQEYVVILKAGRAELRLYDTDLQVYVKDECVWSALQPPAVESDGKQVDSIYF